MTLHGLDRIARNAARAANAQGAKILLAQRCGRARVGGTWGIARWGSQKSSDRDDWQEHTSTLAHDTLTFVPLKTEHRVIGAVEVWRRPEPAPRRRTDLEVLGRLSDDVAAAVLTSQRVDRQRRQLQETQHIAQAMREHNHEHANRVHTIAALTAMGEENEARRCIAELMRATTTGTSTPSMT